MVKGIAVITYRRFDYVMQCLQSLHDNNYGGAEVVCVIEDDEYYTPKQKEQMRALLPTGSAIISQPNAGVASAKNNGIKKLWQLGCDEFFLMEEDILMNDSETCNKYSDYAKEHRLHHMNFALHGPMNKGKGFDYYGMTCYPDCVGAFSYYTKEAIKAVGFFDEKFFNAWEHVFHTLLISKKGLTTPFWRFVDHPDSDNLLKEIEGSIDNSSIRPRSDWQLNIKRGKEYALERYGFFLPPRPKNKDIRH